MKIEVLEPHGFCAGVKAAINLAERLAKDAKGKIYCYHEIVHNRQVVQDLEARGFVFVNDIASVPQGATLLFSAHGVSGKIRAQATAADLIVADATCPFVKSVHKQAHEYEAKGLSVVVLGNNGHDEVVGLLDSLNNGWLYPDLPENVKEIGFVSQTTLDSGYVNEVLSELGKRYTVHSSAKVCMATRERQDAVRKFTGDCLLVLGSGNSSNTNRLKEIAPCRSYIVQDLQDLDSVDFSNTRHLGVTSGASTPESFLNKVLDALALKFP